MKTDNDSSQGDIKALNDLLVNCEDFGRLESMLGGFNLFQVLKFEHGEIRHSNVLAWVLDPNESHGLDDNFLKKWLMRVIHEYQGEMLTVISPVDIDAWQLVDVEVRREWQSIDILAVLKFADSKPWVLCIENKIGSNQHSDQLRRYKETVRAHYGVAERHLFIFLTKNDEQPEDADYITASYSQVYQALKESMQSKAHAIGSEPRVLLDNYLRLLQEKFMDESEIARTARRIYQQHRRALDVIFEQRPDNLRLISDGVKTMLEEASIELGIKVLNSTKSNIRFIPFEWDVSSNVNATGNAISGVSYGILFEVLLGGKCPFLNVVSWKALDSLVAALWERSDSPPFKRQKRKERPKEWCTLHSIKGSNISLDEQGIEDQDVNIKTVYEWVAKTIKSSATREVVEVVAQVMNSRIKL